MSNVIKTTIDEAIARIDDWKGCDISYEPVAGGITNPNFKVTVDGTDFFLKIPGDGTDFIDRECCHLANKAADETGAGPKDFYYFPDTGVEVFEWLEGYSPVTFSEALNEELLTQVITKISKYHNSGVVLPVESTLFDQAWDMIERAKANTFTPPAHDRMMYLLKAIEDAMKTCGIKMAPCHNDFWVNNWMYNRETGDIKFIDFEYASMNDPYCEIALGAGHTLGEAGDMLINKIYHGGQFDELGYAKMKLYQLVVDIKWSYWALQQEVNSNVDFDFFSWYAGKVARLQWMWNDTRLDYWLNLLNGRPIFRR